MLAPSPYIVEDVEDKQRKQLVIQAWNQIEESIADLIYTYGLPIALKAITASISDGGRYGDSPYKLPSHYCLIKFGDALDAIKNEKELDQLKS